MKKNTISRTNICPTSFALSPLLRPGRFIRWLSTETAKMSTRLPNKKFRVESVFRIFHLASSICRDSPIIGSWRWDVNYSKFFDSIAESKNIFLAGRRSKSITPLNNFFTQTVFLSSSLHVATCIQINSRVFSINSQSLSIAQCKHHTYYFITYELLTSLSPRANLPRGSSLPLLLKITIQYSFHHLESI